MVGDLPAAGLGQCNTSVDVVHLVRTGMSAIPTSTNVPGVTMGTLSTSHAMWLAGTFRDAGHTGFIERTNAASTANPATRTLHLVNTHRPYTLTRITDNL